MTRDERFFLVMDDLAFGWLKNPALQKLFALINRDGEEVRVVGGAVRNALIGEPVSDIDCATTAEPSLVMDWARAAGIRVLPTGLDHGTVTLLIDDQAFEVTTLRSDVETDGRHAKVAFGRDWSTDAERRDFTMNAIYVDAEGRLFDPLARGIADAKTRCVRFIGSPEKRIEEDYLRVLRFFRFFAEYGRHYNNQDYRACVAAQKKLSSLSAERVGTEMSKLLKGQFALDALSEMHRGGMLPQILASVPHLSRFGRLLTLSSLLKMTPDLSLLMCTLCVEVGEDAQRVAKKLRLTNRLRDDMICLVDAARSIQTLSEESLQRLAYRYGKDMAVNLALLARVDRRVDTDLTELSMMLYNLDHWPLPIFPISGRDLLDRGMKPGPDMGEALSALEEIWIDSGFQVGRTELLTSKLRTLKAI